MDNYDWQYRKLTLKQKFGYGVGDMGMNISYGTVTGLLTFFYTDYAGLAAGVVAFVLAISRIPDAFSDVIIGLIVERTHKKGSDKVRPWIKRNIIPLAICTVLLFTVPITAASTVKAVYLFIAYNLLNTVFFTAMNLPYGALSSLMTRDYVERQKLCGWRMAFAPWGRLVSVGLSVPMIMALGNDQKAWIIVMAIWAAVSIIPLTITYKWTDEVVDIAPEKTEKRPIKESVLYCIKNPYWWAVGVLWGFIVAQYTLVGTALPYYCKYIFGSEIYYSPVYIGELLAWSIVSLLSAMIIKRWGKRNICLIGSIIAIVLQAIFWAAFPESPAGLIVITILRAIATGTLIPTGFSFMSDVVEWTQWKYHIREEGMIFSSTGMFYKAMSAITAAIIGAMMQSAGYIPSTGESVVQPDAVIDIIPVIYNGGIIIIYIVIAIIMLFWKIDKQYPQIMEELEERKRKGIM